eukprot:PITA_34051
MCWVYLLKNKSNAFQTFKNFHTWIENDAQSHIGSIHTDNGKEYTSNEFENYLCQHGIKHQTIVPYSPQHNGVAEIMNRTILNMVHSMMFFKNVKLMFWADVVLCVVIDVKNRCPSNVIRSKTPYEMWYGNIPSVNHLRVFGSTCYALIPKIPHLEGGIPILDQYVESSSNALSSPHETPTTDETLSDVIDRIGRLNLDSIPTQSTVKPGPSQKGPQKWLTKTLENVHPDEVGKIGTRNSTKQNGGDVDDSNSPFDRDVSYDCELNLPTDFELTSFKESASHDERKEVIQKEYDAFIKNGTWKIVDPPLRTKLIGCKWVYKDKYKGDGSLEKHKARLVAKCFAQKEGVDYEKFFPTTKWATIWTLFFLAAQNGWKVHQMDVKTSFLNGDLKENVFMSQLEGFVVKGHEHKV